MGPGDPVERYPQPRANERPAAPTRLRPPLFRRYRHPPAALQYQSAAVLAETVSAGAAGGRARYLFFAKDWIRFRLTGVAALELTDASSSLLNQQTGSWSSVVMNEMGLNELLPLFPPLLAPDALAGTLSDAVAALTGLPAATPVAAGALDVCSAALGCGAVNEGDIYTILGTTCCTGIVCRGPQTVNEATRFVTHTEAGQVISLFPMQAGTPNIDWLQQHISLDADLGRLEQAIAEVEPGSGGVFWQPYLNGERAPFYSPDARAGFFGISPHTTRAELQRAVFEGLAFAIVDALQGYPQGGGAVSDRRRRSLGDLAADYRRLYRTHGGLQRL